HSRLDDRTRTYRMEASTTHWKLQMDHLVTAYLDYRLPDPGDGMPPSTKTSAGVVTEESSGLSLVNMELVDLFSCWQETLVPRAHHIYPNETLI
ncbi:hypothetical protein BU15DRAFT_27886, partial [Melanogaster broomeanus]